MSDDPDSPLRRALRGEGPWDKDAAGRREALLRALAEMRPKMDDVIASSTASSTELRALAASTPQVVLNAGTDDAIKRIEHETSRLASIAADMADNTRSTAEISRAGLDQSIALVAGLVDLHETTKRGLAASERSSNVLVFLTRVLVVETVVLTILTAVLVAR